jgi:hypothetical protein
LEAVVRADTLFYEFMCGRGQRREKDERTFIADREIWRAYLAE